MNTPLVHVILLAAGRSTRLGGDVAKPWRDLGGRPVLAHSLKRLAEHPRITSGVIVAAESAIDDAAALALPVGWRTAIGGHERAFSVKSGLDAIADDAPDYVLIHDAARPFVIADVVTTLLDALDDGVDGAIPGLAAADSLKTADNGLVTGRVARDGIWRVQTPQAFRFAMIKACHDADTDGLASDDSTLIEDHGGTVRMVPGDALMDKITTADDLARANLINAGMTQEGSPSMQDAQQHETRMATGYDVHKFSTAPGPIMIGGVALDHEFGFEAHSDGDVALHALTDALYGLIADGDIGSHFPPTDPQWQDKDSAFFLTEALTALTKNGGQLRFVDLTIIAEWPKIGPYRAAISTRIAAILGLPVTRVSVKATTSEGLGFTGRREGIAVQAAATAVFSLGENHA